MNLERVQAEGVKTLARFSTRGDVYDIDIHEENAAPKACLEVFNDADWAANKQTRRSISSSCVFFGTCLPCSILHLVLRGWFLFRLVNQKHRRLVQQHVMVYYFEG